MNKMFTHEIDLVRELSNVSDSQETTLEQEIILPVVEQQVFNRYDFFEYICRQALDTYQRKNSDYGGSFTKLYEEFGMVSPIVKLSDKLERLKSLTVSKTSQKVLDESVEDTLLDLANYAIMTLVERKMEKQQEDIANG